jgi:PAS domain S-box-containing protein
LLVLEVTLSALFEAPDGVPVSPGDHAVRFYDQEDKLLDEVGEFLDAALLSGGHAVAIATAEHLTQLKRRIIGFGGRTELQDRLVLLDAEETLDVFMVGGSPDAALFEARLVPVISQVPPDKPLHAFGEMVAILCERGQYEAALALETLWNGLVRRHRFSLFCAYPRRLFASSDRLRAFQHVCGAHGSLLNLRDSETEDDQDPSQVLLRLRHRTVALEVELERSREAQQALRRREREFAEFLDNASEGIHKVAGDGTILYANRAELEMLGYGWEEYVGHSITEFYVEQQRVEQILTRLRSGEVLRDEPALMRCKDGSPKHVLICSNGYFENAELVYTRCFTRSAVDRIARDQALEQRNNLIRQAPIGAALLVGPELRFALANEAWCRMFEKTEVEGRAFADVFPEFAGAEPEHLIRQVLRTGQLFTSNEYRTLLSTGAGLQERFFRLSFHPLARPDGSTEGVIGIAVDTTEQAKAHRLMESAALEREQLLQGARAASRAKDEFLAMLGHELRNPLAPIVTALQLMRMRGDTATAREQDIIKRQVDHLVGLVDDLLDISRVTRGRIELKRTINDMSAMLAKAVEQASLLMEQRSHELHVDVEPELACDCDPVRIAQVIANLLTNAARYTDVGGHIWLRAWRSEAGTVAVSVRDNGRGIAADTLPRVFELFFQGERGVDRAEGGLGIGLALVKNLVELHGGRVEARSAGKGCGSEFVVYLPSTARAVAVAQSSDSVSGRRVAGEGKRILLVDDNEDAAHILGELLGLSGHEVRILNDPVSALEALDHFCPDVAVLDLGLPVMDGYELARRVREACGPSCTLVALTGYGRDADKERARAAGFHRHFVKPVAPDQLLAFLEEV